MTSETQSPAEIEREIETERAELKRSMEDIQDRFSIDGIVRQVGDQLREHGGDFSRSVAQSARDNPLALAVTGVGLAWLIFGSGRSDHDDDDRDYDHYDTPDRTVRTRARVRSRPVSRRPAPTHTPPQRDLPSWAHGVEPAYGVDADHPPFREQTSPSSYGDSSGGAGSTVAAKASSMAGSVSDAASNASDKAADAWESTKSGLSDAASSAKQRADAMRRKLSEGTEHLGEEARARVVAARERAVEARHQAERSLRRGADHAVDFYEDHPLVAGALALAVGAAIAGALPRTRFEDEHMGASSDELFEEAERIYEEERDKAAKVAQAGLSEAKKVAEETREDIDDRAPGDKSAVEAAADKAKAAGERVADAVKDEADKENLGKPKT